MLGLDAVREGLEARGPGVDRRLVADVAKGPCLLRSVYAPTRM
jgi:hypothetical protein